MATAPQIGTNPDLDGPPPPALDPPRGDGRSESLDRRTRAIGRELFDRIGRERRPWRRSWWDDRFMAMTLDDPMVRVQLFRFIDVLPTLRDADSLRRHLAEYLDEAGDAVPWWLDLALRLSPERTTRAEWLAAASRTAAGIMARKFIAGATPGEALETVLNLRRRRLAFTADLLGEAIISEAEADWYQQTCLSMIDELTGPLSAAAEVPQIDRDQHGPISRVNLSLKLSSLTAHFEAIHAKASIQHAAARLRPILRAARDRGAYVHVNMEQYDHRALTYDLFRRVLAEPEFRDWPDVGIVVQAYHPEAEAELRMLHDWVESRGAPITIRLVKGAYWDHEVLSARRLGWPEPVYLEKWQSDASYERCTRFLLRHHEQLRPAFGSHNVRSIAHAIAAAEAMDLPRSAYEFQTLYGMGDAIQGRWWTAGIGSASTRHTGPSCRAWPISSAACWKTPRTSRSSS